ncbi:glycosyltransferase family 87 protein [Pseudooceanicola sp.]|uniref:glycosyltransferase family 87 protein n=1 Tax=Pseudooceanicola sp. TaxID=1914328 RepID=UPI00261256B1|nr:glycosyltransferase family 87 protein [Pseudooceanicola sp.]MDF1854422.1 glycosyltransferase family 87 protein [Pseudooceanicola sp.]
MSFHPRVAPPLVGLRASSIRLILAMIAVLIAVTAAQIGLPGLLGQSAAFVDFHVFHLAGKLALSGNLAQAYHSADFAPLQQTQPGFSAFMPYTYPPQFNLIAAVLALLPQALAYLMIVGGGFAAWLLILNRLGIAQAGGAALMVLPAAVVCVRYGQNGFLSAALIGGFCLWSLRGRALAGPPLRSAARWSI